MKKLQFILFLFIVVSQQLSAQVKTDSFKHVRLSDRELGLQYLKKANTQRTVAWFLLGGGLAMEILATSRLSYDIYDENLGAETVLLLGSLCMIASVPVFISGARNRGRAEILLRYENLRVYNNYGSGKEGVVSLGLSIPFRGSRK